MDGRLEVYLSDDQGTLQWGTVCGDEFGAAEVAVVCHQLGHPSVGSHYYDTDNYAGVEVPIWMDNLRCAGTETRLTDCPRSTEPANCYHWEDAWVDCRPEISIDLQQSRAVEGEDILFLLTRSTRRGEENSTPKLEVAVSVTENGAMISGTPPTGVTFAAGSTSATLTVSTVDDEVVESNSTIRARLTSSAGDLYRLEPYPSSILTVADDDHATIQARLGDAPDFGVIEGDDVLFDLSRQDGDVTQALVLDVKVTEHQRSSAFNTSTARGMILSQPAPTAFTFAANRTVATLTVATVDDEVSERDVTVRLEIVSPDDGRYEWDGQPISQHVRDNDVIETNLFVDADMSAPYHEGDDVLFYVRRIGIATQALTLALTVSDQGSMVRLPAPTSVTFAAGSATATVTVATVDDAVDEPDSVLSVILDGPRQGPGYYILYKWDTVTVLDNDGTLTSHGDVRFAGPTARADHGRVEVFLDRQWKSICLWGDGEQFDDREAGIVCRQLGYDTGRSEVEGSYSHTTPIGPHFVCTGSEERLIDCPSHPEECYQEIVGRASCQNAPDVSVSFAQSSYTLVEGRTVAVPVALGEAAEAELVIPLTATAGGGAEAEVDYTVSASTLTFAAGESEAAVTVAALAESSSGSLANPDDEEGEHVTLGLGALPDGYRAGTPATAVVQLADPLALLGENVKVSFGAASYQVAEGESVAVPVLLDLVPQREVVIPLTAVSTDGAEAGVDYTLSAEALTFARGATAQTVTVTALADQVAGDNEFVDLGFGTLPDEVVAGSQATASVLIADSITVRFGAAEYAVAEGESVGVTVELSADPEAQVVIPVTATGAGGAVAGDYEVAATAVTFGSGETRRTVTVMAVDDRVDDDGESVELSLGTVPDTFAAGSPGRATVSLVDDDVRGVAAPAAVAVLEGSSASYLVALESEPTGTVRVSVTADGGVTVSPDELEFTAAGWERGQLVTVAAAEDDDALAETAKVSHTASGADYGGLTAAVAVSVVENDRPAVSIAALTGSAAEDAGPLRFAVRLSTASSETVTVRYATADGTATAGADYAARSGRLSFAPGSTGRTLEVALVDDAADEAEEETLTVTLSEAEHATLGIAQATGRIADNDDPAVEVSYAAAGYAVAEGGAVTVKVKLSAAPEREVVIPLAVTAAGGAGAGDFEVSAQRVTFAGDQSERTVQVTAADDAVDDDGESVELGFGTLPAGVTAGSPRTATVALGDDDERGVTVSPETVSVPEGGSTSYAVVLESQPTAAVKVGVSVPAGAEVTVRPAELEFTAGNWATAQEFTVQAAEDEDALADEPVSLRHTVSGGDYGRVAAAGVEVTITENDRPTLSIESASAREDAGSLGLVVRLSTASSETVTVGYATADGTATAGADYRAQSGRLSFAPGSTELTLEVALIDDAADEEEEAETFTVRLSGAQQATLGIDRATGTIADDDDPEVEVTFAAAGYEVAEGSAVAVTVELNGDPERQVVIPLTVAAAGGAGTGDYTGPAAAVTFASGETVQMVLVSAVDDLVDDDGEGVTVGFGALPARVTARAPLTAAVAIADDDERGVQVSEEALAVLEGGSASYTVALASEPTAAVAVSVNLPAGSEVTVTPEELEFTAADWDTPRRLTVRAAEDEDALVDAAVTVSHTVRGGDYRDVAAAGVEVTIIENDTPVLSVVPEVSAPEGAGALAFAVSLSTASSDTVTVGYATADGTATAGADYRAQSGTLSFAPGSTALTLAVVLVDDAVDELEEETFTVMLSAAQGAALPPQVARATATIEDDDDPVVSVYFAAAEYAVAEGAEVAVAVALSGDPEREVPIALTAQPAGGAGAGDYAQPAAAVTFASGETVRMVPVSAVDDRVDDDGESVRLGLGTPLPAGVTLDSEQAATASVSIVDDDARGVKVSAESVQVLEGGAASYTIELESEPTEAVTVRVSQAPATDVRVAPEELEFTAADWDRPRELTVTAAEDADTLADAEVSFTHAASGGDYAGLAAAVTVTVIENDTPTLSIASGSAVENAGELALAVSLSTASSETVTVAYATVDGTAVAGADYRAQRGTLTLVPGSTVGTIAVALIDDAADEAEEETFTVMLEDARHALLGFAQATVTLADDDDPAVEVSFAAAEYAVAEGAEVAVTVTLSADPEREVVIPVTAQPAGGAVTGDYTVTAAALTFGSGETARRITVTAVDDLVDDDGESVRLGFGSPLPARVTVGGRATARVRLGDDDGSGLRVEPQQVSVAEGASASYTVALDSQPAGMVTVTVTVAPGTDLTVAPEELKFTVVDWSEAQTVTVTAAADADALADAAVTVTHAASGGGYAGVTAAVTVTVIETDAAALSIADGRAAEDAGALALVVSLNPASSETVTVAYATADGSAQAGRDYTAQRGGLTFAPGETRRTLAVAVIDDAEDEEAETFTVTLSEARQAWVAIATATGTIADDEQPADTSGPGLRIGSAAELPANGPFGVSLEFSESVSGLALGEIEVSNGTAAGLTGAGASYGVTITPRADYAGEVTVTVAAGAAADAEGNGNAAGSAVFAVDTRAPTVPETTLEQGPSEWTEPTVSGPGSAGGVVQYPDGSGNRAAVTREAEAEVPVVAISALAEIASEGDDVLFSLTRTGSTAQELTVELTVTKSGSINLDPQPPTGATFAVGAAATTLTVRTHDDDIRNHNGTLAVTVAAPADARYVVSAYPTAETVVWDNERLQVTISVSTAARLIEGQDAVFSLRRDGPTTQAASVGVKVKESGSMILAPAPTQVTFAVGAAAASLTVATVDDTVAEDDSIIQVDVNQPEIHGFGSVAETLSVLDDDSSLPSRGDLRLQDGSTALSGRVEVFVNNRWGTVCDDSFTGQDAAVACRQLGHYGGATIANAKAISTPSAPIWMDNVGCTGTETRLTDCPYSYPSNCYDGEAVWVACSGPPAVAVSFAADNYAVVERTSVAVTVQLSADPQRELVIPLQVTTAGGAGTEDYTVAPLRLTFVSGATSRAVTVTASHDEELERGESVTLGFGTLPVAVTIGTPATATVLLADTASLLPTPQVSFKSAGGAISEGLSIALPVALSTVLERAVVIPLTVQPAGGAGEEDYTVAPLQLTFARGTTRHTVTVTAEDDQVDDDGESVTLGFGELPEGVAADTTAATVTVEIGDDDDPPTLSLEVSADTLAEGDTVTVTVATGGGAFGTAQTIALTLGGSATEGIDYAIAPASITLAAGATAGTATITVEDDAVVEDAETITITARHGTTVIGTRNISISRSDTPNFSLTVSPATIAEGETATVTVATGGAIFGSAQTISLARSGNATAGTDYAIAPASITLAAGATAGTATITVRDDAVVEDAETITITARHGTTVIGTRNITISRSDTPNFSLTVSPDTIAEGETATVTVATGGAIFGSAQTISLARSGSAAVGTDYAIAPASITLAAGATAGSVTISALDDIEVEDAETITLAASHGATAAGTATVTIARSDQPNFGVTVSPDTITEGETATVTVTTGGVTFGTAQDITLDFAGSTAAGADYLVAPRSITIAAGALAGSAVITARNDTEVEDAETITLAASHGATAAGTGSVTIARNDQPDFSVTVSPATIAEGETAVVTVTTGGVTFATAQSIALDFAGSTAAETDYVVAPRSITIAAGVTAGSATVTAVDDTEVEQGEVIALAASHGTTPIGAGSITISANDRTAFSIAVDPAGAGIAEGETATVTVHTGGVTFATERTIELTLGGDATAGTDYTITTRSITIVTGATAGTTTVAALEDIEVEPAETITIGAAIDATPIGSRNITIAASDPPAFAIAVDPAGASIAEGEAATVTVSTGGVTFATEQTIELMVGGDATAGTDYTITTRSITLAAGATAGTTTVEALEDTEVEPAETITVAASHGPEVIGTATITIPENDPPAFSMTVDPAGAGIAEGETATLTVSTGGVTFATRQTVSLDFTGSTAGADDYLVVPANILLAAGATLGTATITVVNDRVVETRETIVVTAGHDSAPVGAATISIPPSDQPDFGLAVSSDIIAEGESAVLTVTTGGVTFTEDQTIELDLGGSATAGSDYTVTPSDITLRAGATAGSATIRAVDDSEVEERETIAIAATHDGTAIAAAATVTISAGDRTAFRLTVDPAAATIAEGESAVLTVTTGGVTFAEEQTIELDLGGSATAGSDYTVTPSAITIGAGAMAGSATITAVDDSAAEDSETITIAATHGATPVGTRNITIAASDRPVLRLTVAPASAIAEGESAVLTVTTGGVTFTEEQTIELELGGSATAGSDYTITPSAITIGAGAVAGTATITAVDDSDTEDSETIVIAARHGSTPIGTVAVTIGANDEGATPRDETGPALMIGSAAEFPANGPFGVSLEFSESVSGLGLAEIEVSNGTAAGLTGAGASYRATITPRADYAGEVTVRVTAGAAEDAEGNGNVAGSGVFAVDTRAPTVTETTLEQGLSEWTDPIVSGADSAGGVVQYPDGSGNRAAVERDGGAAAAEREAYARVNRALLPNLVGAVQASTQEAIDERELTAGVLSLAGRPVLEPAAAGPRQQQQVSAAGEPWEEPATALSMGVRELLEGSAFVLPLAMSGAAPAGSGGGVALWGRGDYRRLASGAEAEAEVEWSGGLLSVHVGADLRVVPELLAGVAVTWAQGGFDYTERSAAAAVSGEYETELIGVYPYASWTAPGIGVGLWATAGYGWGEVVIAGQRETQRKSALRLLTGALGGSGRLLATERLIAGGNTLLRLKGSGEVARIELEEAGPIAEQELEVRRLRVALEGSHAQRLAWGGRLTPVLEVGVRYDEDAGTEGAGLELGGELRYAHPELGLTVAGHGRLLALHQAGYEEWGAGGLIRVQQGAERRGLRLSVAPGLSAGGEPPAGATDAEGRLQAELGYGLELLEGSGVLTPYGVLTLAGAERDYRAGARLELEGFHLELEGRRREAAADAPEHDLTLRGGLRY